MMLILLQFVGYNDDVLDMAFFGDGDSHLAVATNSELVKVFETSTWNCQILSGHTDIVLCVGVGMNGALLATGSKVDSSLYIYWQKLFGFPYTYRFQRFTVGFQV